jgi:site-specific DNA-methyltransferase (adenine-specific)
MTPNNTELEALRHYYYQQEAGTELPDKLELNAIYHMDCLDGIKLIPSNSVKLIVSDPPYFLGMTHNGQRGNFVDLAICKPFYRELFKQYKRILNADGEVYWFTDWRGYAFYYPLFDAFLGARNVICWDKMSGAGNFYAFQHEFILFHCVRNDATKKGGNVWRSKGFAAGAKTTNGEKVHPTQKTIEIIEKIVGENSKPGDLVVDTFGGSGTTAVVCRKLDRNYIVFELDEDNIGIANKRAELPYNSTLFK